MPLTVVGVMAPKVRVIAGVEVAVATVPETPLAVVTDTEVTEPVAAEVQVGARVVPAEVKTCPAVPFASIAVVPAADWYGIEPPSPPARLVAVVAVAALPVMEPVIGLVTVKLTNVPTEVKEEAVTPELSVVPVRVKAAAVTVMSAVPLKETPLIFRAVCKAVAVPAFPVTVV
jgi:hypothetical protein